ncbi:MAG TPA: hypothetical protein VGR96_07505 [Acidobacteriaceae bacterium]|nr:hypothetical protein [Acidobacteriaceae bacterium]
MAFRPIAEARIAAGAALLLGGMCASALTISGPGDVSASAQECTRLLQAQDAGSVQACKLQLDQANAAPPTERMARIVANDEYGIALLAYGHAPRQGLEAFDREIGMLPASTVKPDSLQWAVAYWHRATAYQQLGQLDSAIQDLRTAEDTLRKAAETSANDTQRKQHFEELRKRVVAQHAGLLERQGKHAEAKRVLRAE